MLNVDEQDFLNYFKHHSIKDCCEYYNVKKAQVLSYMSFYAIPQHTRSEIGVINSIKQKTKIDIDELTDFYIIKNNTRKDTALHFGVSEALIKKICSANGIVKTVDNIINNTKKTLISKYGTDNLMNISVDKRKQTVRERYGTDYVFQSQQIQAKVADSKVSNRDFSSMEIYVALYLKNNHISYAREFIVFDEYFMPFDFVIYVDNQMKLIECDGFFHDETRVDRDARKDIYCLENGIELLRISSIEEFEEKIIDFIK